MHHQAAKGDRRGARCASFVPLCFGGTCRATFRRKRFLLTGSPAPPNSRNRSPDVAQKGRPPPLAVSRPANLAGSWAHAHPHPPPIPRSPPRMLANLLRRYSCRDDHRARRQPSRHRAMGMALRLLCGFTSVARSFGELSLIDQTARRHIVPLRPSTPEAACASKADGFRKCLYVVLIDGLE
jgi:hypothetical protein